MNCITPPGLSSNRCVRCGSVSHIREAMVKLLARPAVGHPSQVPHNRDGSFEEVAPEGRLNPFLRGHQLPEDLSTCVFWCAVGLGALVKGNPIESVRLSILSTSLRFPFQILFPNRIPMSPSLLFRTC